MKIAFIGKGGSGKSTVSWLATRVLAQEGRRVLAIDADHNMDLASLLGVVVTDTTPTLHRHADAFRAAVGQREDRRWQEIVLDGRPLPAFTFPEKDPYTESIALPVSGGVELAVVGLGANDVLFSDRCAHGHSASLKFYLPLLNEGADGDVVIDGVAGADMLNFGLFLGCDAVAVVVEPHPNSMRVLTQVAGIAERTGLPLYVVVNKVQGATPLLGELEAQWGERIVGRIPADPGLISYDMTMLAPATLQAGTTMLKALRERAQGHSDGLARLRAFETERAKARS